MRIALNRCFGGFSLSKECLEMIFNNISVDERKKLFNNPYIYYPDRYHSEGELVVDGMVWYPRYHSVEFRTNEWVIKAIECLGERANGQCADIEISNIVSEIEISDYDGKESVRVGGRRYE